MGRRYCCVPGCSNTSKTVKDGTKVFLHRLPMSGKKKNIKQQWIRRLRNVRTDLIINDHTRVCSDHFEGVFTNNSVPTIFPSKPKVHSRERRPLIRHGNIVCNSRVPLNELKTGALGEVDFDTSNNQENLSVPDRFHNDLQKIIYLACHTIQPNGGPGVDIDVVIVKLAGEDY